MAVIGSRAADQITFLDIVDAVEGRKPLFDCREIRGRCAVFDDTPPRWATRGVCAIHAVMLRVENVMRAELSRSSSADPLSLERKPTATFAADLDAWITCVGSVPRPATKVRFLDEAVLRSARTPNQMLAGAAPALSTEARSPHATTCDLQPRHSPAPPR